MVNNYSEIQVVLFNLILEAKHQEWYQTIQYDTIVDTDFNNYSILLSL